MCAPCKLSELLFRPSYIKYTMKYNMFKPIKHNYDRNKSCRLLLIRVEDIKMRFTIRLAVFVLLLYLSVTLLLITTGTKYFNYSSLVVFHYKKHFTTTIIIQTLFNKFISIVVGYEVYYKK